MTFSWDFNTTTMMAIGVQTIAFIVFLFKTHYMARASEKSAAEAHDKIDNLEFSTNGAIAGLTAAIALVREQYADKAALRDMENRITAAIKQVSDQLHQFLIQRGAGS